MLVLVGNTRTRVGSRGGPVNTRIVGDSLLSGTACRERSGGIAIYKRSQMLPAFALRDGANR